MAKRWNPDSSAVNKTERVGRRLFDEPMLIGASEQPNFSGIQFTHFEEKRDGEISLDRLGRTSIEPKVRGYLIPRCERAATLFSAPKRFNGWAAVQVKELTEARKPPNMKVIASPVNIKANEDELLENVYHAHTCCPDITDNYLTALHLRHIFVTYGEIEKLPSLDSNSKLGLISKLRDFGKLLQKVRSYWNKRSM